MPSTGGRSRFTVSPSCGVIITTFGNGVGGNVGVDDGAGVIVAEGEEVAVGVEVEIGVGETVAVDVEVEVGVGVLVGVAVDVTPATTGGVPLSSGWRHVAPRA